jgi:hypothetical protein
VKIFISVLFMLLLAVPASAKPRDVFPVSCEDLWSAVNLTLSDQGNYRVASVDDLNMRVSFIVVGNLTTYTDRVALNTLETGCQMKLAITQVGSDDSDARGFRKRLAKSLAKVEAAKSAAPAQTPASVTGNQ